jgi:hypothetical protein
MSVTAIAPPTTLFGTQVNPALFASRVGEDNLGFARQVLKELEPESAGELFAEYQRRLAKGAPKSANIWLRKSAEFLGAQQARIPVPVSAIREDAGQERIAKQFSSDVTHIVQHLTEGMTKRVSVKKLLAEAQRPANQWGVCPLMPVIKNEATDAQLDMAAAALARLQDADWWQRQISKVYRRHRELIAILTGKVRRGVSPYVSRRAALDYRANKTAQARWLADMMVVNDEHDLQLSLAEAHAAGVSNPENRRVELMVRMRGCEDWATEHGYVAEFYTWTTPSRFHAWTTKKGGKGATRNGKFKGTNPRQAQRYMCSQWAKARAKLARDGVSYYGFRVAEPHHDGTPHWHLLLFVRPEQRDQLRAVIEHYACEEDQEELKHNRRARFDAVSIDPERGSATGYVAKYVAKNIDGHKVGADYEAQAEAGSTALNVAAWASLWGIRQFQQIGGPAVSVWRELRRLREAVGLPAVEAARAAADKADWSAYIDAMGGIEMSRKERPIQLAHLVKPCASKYGEDLRRLVGVRSEGVDLLRTRLDGWEVISRRRMAAGSGERGELGLGRRQPAPWSSDNNCTGSKIDRELARLGLDAVDRQRMEAGSVVTIDGFFCWIRAGVLHQSRERPQFRASQAAPPPCSEAAAWEKAAQRALRERARAVVRDELDISDFIDENNDPEPALAALDDALHRERKGAPLTFREDLRLVLLSGFVTEGLSEIRAAKWADAHR